MRNKVELLAPAGSPEGIRAAVQSGAGAVYMGFGMFNARRNAQGFSHDEMADAIAYCRARDVKTNITLNILAGDRELEDALEDAKFLYEAGADALIVQDLGLARLIHAHAPDFALHASTQMTIHTLDAAKQARDIGFSRVVLSRECSREEIKLITEQAGVETEVFVHGALCMCYSGQCYLSAVIGQRSGNRGLCAQPCRLPYSGGYPLSLKDLMLAGHVAELSDWGVSSLKIEGRMKLGIPVILVIEVEGAGNIKKMYPGATTIFVLPPDMAELERRLRCRGTEDEATIQRRLKRAETEIANSVNYDEHVVNIAVDSCADSLYSIIQFRLQHGSDE